MFQSENKILERKKIYKNLDSSFTRKEGILLTKKTKQRDIFKLSSSIEIFIYKSLKKFFPNKKIYKKNFLKKNINLIIKLPNVTPGGQLRGTKELIKEYSSIHKEFLKVLKKINLFKDLQRLGWFSVESKKVMILNLIRNILTQLQRSIVTCGQVREITQK